MRIFDPAPKLFRGKKLPLHFTVKRTFFWIIVAATLAVCGLPLINLIRMGASHFSPQAFDARVGRAALNTLILAAGTTVTAIAIGTLCGFFISRTNLPAKKTVKTLLLYPYVIPPFITALGWVVLGNPNVGLIGKIIPGFSIYTMPGLVAVESLFWYTYVLLNVGNVLEGMDGSLEESARMCGASPARIFFSITLPLLKPTLIGSGLIVFLCSASSFGVPAIIGGPGKIFVLTTTILNFIRAGQLGEAITLSLPIVVSAFVLIYFSERWLNRKSFATLTGKHNRKLEVNLRAARWPSFVLFVALCAVAVGMPLATIIVTSLMSYYGNWNLSFDNYRTVLASADTLMSLKNSFALAFGGSLILCFLSFFIAYYKEKTRYRFRNLLVAFATLPYATPGTVVALAIYFSLISWHPAWWLLLAYVAKYLSHGIKVMSPSFINVDKSLEESSLMCGASWPKTVLKIWVPILKGTLSTGVFLMIAPLFSELTMSVLLATKDFPTVGTRLFHLQEYENPNHAAVLAVIVLAFVIGLNAAVKKISRGKLGV